VTLAVLLDAYTEEELGEGDVRTVLKLDPKIAPVKVAILPLSKKEQLIGKAQELYKKLFKKRISSSTSTSRVASVSVTPAARMKSALPSALRSTLAPSAKMRNREKRIP